MNKGDTDLIEWLDTAYAYNSNTKYFGKPTDDVVLYNNFKKIYRLK